MGTNGTVFVCEQISNKFLCCILDYFALLGYCGIKVSFGDKTQAKNPFVVQCYFLISG